MNPADRIAGAEAERDAALAQLAEVERERWRSAVARACEARGIREDDFDVVTEMIEERLGERAQNGEWPALDEALDAFVAERPHWVESEPKPSTPMISASNPHADRSRPLGLAALKRMSPQEIAALPPGVALRAVTRP